MKTILISALILILVTAVVLLYRNNYVKREFRKLLAHQYSIVAPLIEKLESQKGVTTLEVLTMVKDPSLRCSVYRVLKLHNRTDLFPTEYYTREKGAEGFMVNWLEFPTELGNAPDEIEFLTMVTIYESEPLDYYVFRYKTKKPNLPGQNSWMIGVSGPYQNSSQPYDVPFRVYSRFNSQDNISPEHEVQWVHQNIHKT